MTIQIKKGKLIIILKSIFYLIKTIWLNEYKIIHKFLYFFGTRNLNKKRNKYMVMQRFSMI